MLQVVERIAKSVSVPVTADMEAGYGEGATTVADTAKRVIAAGAIGLNIEDSTTTLHQLREEHDKHDLASMH